MAFTRKPLGQQLSSSEVSQASVALTPSTTDVSVAQQLPSNSDACSKPTVPNKPGKPMAFARKPAASGGPTVVNSEGKDERAETVSNSVKTNTFFPSPSASITHLIPDTFTAGDRIHISRNTASTLTGQFQSHLVNPVNYNTTPARLPTTHPELKLGSIRVGYYGISLVNSDERQRDRERREKERQQRQQRGQQGGRLTPTPTPTTVSSPSCAATPTGTEQLLDVTTGTNREKESLFLAPTPTDNLITSGSKGFSASMSANESTFLKAAQFSTLMAQGAPADHNNNGDASVNSKKKEPQYEQENQPAGTGTMTQHTTEADTRAAPSMVQLDDLEFRRELGRGACGSVALYRHKDYHNPHGDSVKKKYAVKTINLAGKQQSITAVASEIKSVFMTPSAFTVRLYNAFYRDNCLHLVMEFMDGGDLEDFMEKASSCVVDSDDCGGALLIHPRTGNRRLSEPCASYVAWCLMSALACLHTRAEAANEKRSGASSLNTSSTTGSRSRQIHRDIKPANMLLSSEKKTIKLADFGVAGQADSIGLASFVGTATYMSPERIKGELYGTPSDVWSAGLVIAQLLKGEYPFSQCVECGKKSNSTHNNGSGFVLPAVGKGGGFMALLKEITKFKRIDFSESGNSDDGGKKLVSEEAEDFIALCLKKDEHERATATALLEHPWILRYNHQTSKQSRNHGADPGSSTTDTHEVNPVNDHQQHQPHTSASNVQGASIDGKREFWKMVNAVMSASRQQHAQQPSSKPKCP